MSLVVDKTVFADQLAAVASVVKGKIAHPVLGYVKLEALKSQEEDAVFLTATDLDLYYRRAVEAEVASEFTCLLPTRMVREWLGNISNGSLVVAANGQNVALKSGTNAIEIGTMPWDEFPRWPIFSEPAIATADLAPVSAVMGAAPDTDARLELFDIQISHAGENQLRACSARAVVFAEHLFTGQTKEGHTLHITPPTIAHVAGLGPCSIADGPSFVSFTGDGFSFLSKKLASKPLDFKANFDLWKFAAHSTLIREEFTEAIASCHVLRGLEEHAFVVIEAEEGGLAVHCRNKLGQYRGFIAARVDGEFNPITLPTGQLLQPLRASTEETVELSITNPVHVARLGLGPTTVFIVACRDIPEKK